MLIIQIEFFNVHVEEGVCVVKVADFGLTKLTDSGLSNFSTTMPTRVVGTFGYMPPE